MGRRVGKAVVRNRTKRRLRAIVASAQLAPGAYLVGVSPEAAALPFDDLRAHVDRALRAATGGRT